MTQQTRQNGPFQARWFLVRLAETVRFELTDGCPSAVFKYCAGWF
jgi:hypothetical protein